MRWWLGLTFPVLALAVSACDEPARPSVDRPSGIHVEVCESSLDCGPTAVCIDKRCHEGAYGSVCYAEGECAPGLICRLRDQLCVDCLQIDHCPVGYDCNADGRCESDGTPPGDPAGGDPGGGGGDPGGGGGDPGNAAPELELQLCGGDGQCGAGLVCRAMTKNGTQRCTRACTVNANCPAGLQCLSDGVANVCLGNDSGRACAQADGCNFACLQAPGYCTVPCATGADCPNGYGCMPVGSPAQRVCIKTEAVCDAGDTSACVVPAACDVSPTLILGGCTLACDTALDCPQRAVPLPVWSCDGLCRRPLDVYGSMPGGSLPAQYHCDENQQPVNLCNDAQHIDFAQFTIPSPPFVDCGSMMTTDGLGNDACANSCRYQGACAYGFACVGIGGISAQRVGLCIPTGSGEVGVPCTTHAQCAFGYCADGNCSRDCTVDGVCPGATNCVPGDLPNVEGLPFKRCQ